MGTLAIGIIIAGLIIVVIRSYLLEGRLARTISYSFRMIFIVGVVLCPIFLLGLICITSGVESGNPLVVAFGILVDVVAGWMIWLNITGD